MGESQLYYASERIGYILHDFIYTTSVKNRTIEKMSVRGWD